MTMVANNYNEETAIGVHPLKFMLWLMIVSIIMMFGAFTSAYIVRRAEGNWLEYELPDVLLLNTFIIVISSVTMQLAYNSAKKNNLIALKVFLLSTFALGVAFLVGQSSAWTELVNGNVHFGGSTSNPSGSFLYVLTGVHGFHLITGLILMLFVLRSSFKFRVHSKNMIRMYQCNLYWHFLGGLWLFLYIFLRINH